MPTLSISHFKSIRDLEIELGVVNIFIGANGSGKTNLLEAMGILSAAVQGEVDDMALTRRGVRPGLPRLYKSNFSSVRQYPHIGFSLRNSDAAYSVTLNEGEGSWMYKTEELSADGKKQMSRGPRTDGLKAYGHVPKFLASAEPAKACVSLVERLRDFKIFSPYTPMLRGLVADPNTFNPLGLSGGRLADAVLELKNHIEKSDLAESWDELLDLVEWLSAVDTVQQASNLLSPNVPRSGRLLRFTDRFMRAGKNTLTGHDASEGVLYLLFLGVLVLHKSAPAWLAVDNVDQALNPRLVQRLLGWLCTNTLSHGERCLLFTVHNPACLDTLPLRDDRVRLFAVDRTTKGYTVAQRILVEGLNPNEWPLSRLWVMGHLGGVPNV